MKYKIKDSERGHRPRVSETEELLRWTACTLSSQKQHIMSKGGQKYLRKLIEKDMLDNK